MNLLFGMTIGLISASVFWIFCWLIPEKVWALLPEEVIEWKPTVIRFIGCSILIIVVLNNFNTYGPKVSLDVPIQRYQPSKSEVVETENMFETKSRSTLFSDRIQHETVEPENGEYNRSTRTEVPNGK